MTMTAPSVITEPGCYDGMSEEAYHLDPVPGGSLSSTGAREILGCPAKYLYSQEHGRPDKDAFDLGKVVHALILGTGAAYIELLYDDWTKAAAQRERKAARASGLVPLTRPQFAQAKAIAAAFLASPTAALLAEDGKAERSIFWRDEETGVMCRARFDWTNWLTSVDVKTADDASPKHFPTDVANYGYHVQRSFYVRGLQALGLAGARTPEFYFAAVEKKPPYLVSPPYALDAEAIAIGDELASRALRKFAECRRTGHYPGYPQGTVTLSLPRWATYLPQEDWA